MQSSNLAQSLHLLNSPDVRNKLAHPTGRAEKLAKDARPAEERVRELYRVAFARDPRPDELRAALGYLAESRAAREGYQDVLWALMTSKEFLFNH